MSLEERTYCSTSHGSCRILCKMSRDTGESSPEAGGEFVPVIFISFFACTTRFHFGNCLVRTLFVPLKEGMYKLLEPIYT